MQFSLYAGAVALLSATSVLAAPVAPATGCPIPNFVFPGPADVVSQLLVPPTGTQPKIAVVGIGYQNYTCPTGVPVSIGAVAQLYDASCAMMSNPEAFNELPRLAVLTSPDFQNQFLKTFNIMSKDQLKIGKHYFRNGTTPTFDFGKKGMFFGTVAKKVPAPAGSYPGVAPFAFGAVPWLKISSNPDSIILTQAYRVNTAGGVQPPTCNPGETIQVPYAASYLFF